MSSPVQSGHTAILTVYLDNVFVDKSTLANLQRMVAERSLKPVAGYQGIEVYEDPAMPRGELRFEGPDRIAVAVIVGIGDRETK